MTNAEAIAALENWTASHASLTAMLRTAHTALEAEGWRPVTGGAPESLRLGLVYDGQWHAILSRGDESIDLTSAGFPTPAEAVAAVQSVVELKLNQLQTRLQKFQRAVASITKP